MGTNHPESVTTNNHAITGVGAYADIAARDADSTFNTNSTNVNKVVRVEDSDGAGNVGYFVLTSVAPTWAGVLGGGAVDSVNGETGVVVLDADDIDDSGTTNKFTTAGDITKLAGIETGAEVNVIAFTIPLGANNAQFPSSDPAVADSRNGHPILAFDDTTAESILWSENMPNDYDGENVNVDIDWTAETATTGGVTWGVEFEVNAPGGNDIDSDSFATQQTGTSTTNATSGIITRTTITLTQAQADAIAANDAFRLRVQRVTGDGGDTMTDDAQISKVTVRV